MYINRTLKISLFILDISGNNYNYCKTYITWCNSTHSSADISPPPVEGSSFCRFSIGSNSTSSSTVRPVLDDGIGGKGGVGGAGGAGGDCPIANGVGRGGTGADDDADIPNEGLGL